MRHPWVKCVVMGFGVVTTVHATGPSAASRASVHASAQIIDGSVALIGAGGELTLAAIEIVGDSTRLVLKGARGTVTVSLKVSTTTARVLAASVGAAVETVAVTAGHLLIVSGESVAFLLNADAAEHRHHRTWP